MTARRHSHAIMKSVVKKHTVLAALIAGLIMATGQTGYAGVASSNHLKPPFDIGERRAPMGAPRAIKTACRTPPLPVRDLTFDGFYRGGGDSSVVDREAMNRYRDARGPIDEFERYVIGQSDLYVATAPAASDRAVCVLDWLYRWADAGAYLGTVSRQGGFVRKWSLGTISLAYLKIRDAGGLDAIRKKAVEDWIGRWADIVKADYSTHLDRSSRNNNQAYFDWMVARYRTALRQIDPDGTLPLEVKRGSKALHYHVFSVQALVPIAELGARNGTDLYGAEGGALERLVKRTVAGMADPDWFARKTGQSQSWVGSLNGGKLAWMEPYYARIRDPALLPWIKRFRPLKNRLVGGNATLLYGVKTVAN